MSPKSVTYTEVCICKFESLWYLSLQQDNKDQPPTTSTATLMENIAAPFGGMNTYPPILTSWDVHYTEIWIIITAINKTCSFRLI